MSEKENTKKNFKNMPASLTSGEEPTGLLLQLVWSPIETLIERGQAKVFVGSGRVAILLESVGIDEERGLVPTVANTEKVMQ